MRQILKGSTDISAIIRIVDDTTGQPETGVTSATSGLDLRYRREGAATVTMTESDLSALTDAHTDGGLLHILSGYYRVDIPDAAFASGANGVLICGNVTGMTVIGSYYELVAHNVQDTVRLGLTALPNAAADEAGGLPISDAGGLDLDAQVVTKINSILDDTGTAGVVVNTFTTAGKAEIESEVDDALGSGTGAALTAIPWNSAWDAEVESEVDDALGGGTGTALTAIPWNANWDAEVQSEVTDAIVAHNLDHLCLTATAAADMTTEVADNTIISRMLSNGDTSVFDPSTDGLQPIKDALVTTAQVNAEVVDALATDTYAEPGQGTPAATAALTTMVRYVYAWARNKVTFDGTTENLYADDGSTVAQKRTVSVSSGTITKTEITTGA